MLNLLRMGRLTGRADLEEKGAQIARTFSRKVELFPAAFTQLLVGFDFSVGPSHELVIVGNPEADDTNLFVRALRARFIPNRVVLLKPVDEQVPEIVQLAPYTDAYTALEGRATAYVCSNYSCQLPTTDPGEMLRLLGEQKK